MTDETKIPEGIEGEAPRDYFVRAAYPGAAEVNEEEERPIMRGHLAIFGEPATIDSVVEGQYIERVAPGAFARTIDRNRSRLRVIYDHGQDPRFGRHPLGPIQELKEDERGVYYEVPLLDTSYNRDLIPGLRAGVYGASYRFRPLKVQRTQPSKPSETNPDVWEERTITELEMVEFGPTPFPIYAGTTAGVRSMTDEYRSRQLGIDPEQLRTILSHQALPAVEPEAEPPSDPETRVAVPATPPRFRSREDFLEWLSKS